MIFRLSRSMMSMFTVLGVLQLAVWNILSPDTANGGYSSIVCAAAAPTTAYEAVNGKQYYAVVIDAGSTGSRSFVFNITESVSGESAVEGNEVNQR